MPAGRAAVADRIATSREHSDDAGARFFRIMRIGAYGGFRWPSLRRAAVGERHERTVGRQQREVLLDAVDAERLDELDEAPPIVGVAADRRVMTRSSVAEASTGPSSARRHPQLGQQLGEPQVQIREAAGHARRCASGRRTGRHGRRSGSRRHRQPSARLAGRAPGVEGRRAAVPVLEPEPRAARRATGARAAARARARRPTPAACAAPAAG